MFVFYDFSSFSVGLTFSEKKQSRVLVVTSNIGISLQIQSYSQRIRRCLHKFLHFHFQLAWWNSDTTNISQFQKFFFDGYGVPRITAAFLLSNPARCFFRGPVETLSRSHGCAKEIFFGFLPVPPLKHKACEGGLVFRGEKKDWTSRCFYLKDHDRLTVRRIAMILACFFL